MRSYTEGYNWAAFESDRKTQDAVIRNLEIIGEAAGKLTEDIRATASNVDWRKIVALRNLLVHEYFGVNLAIVWDIIQNKLDSLGAACRKLLEISS